MFMKHHTNKYEFIDHTGDVGVRINAESLEMIFSLAARALFEIVCPECQILSPERRKIQLNSNNIEELLIDWLSELNYLCQIDHFLMGQAHLQLDGTSLKATVEGEYIDGQKHHIQTEIKAVTYHGLYVKKTGNNWEAQIIFDL